MSDPTWDSQTARFKNLKGRGIPIADAPMVYHLWAAFEKVEHSLGDSLYKIQARERILSVLDWVTGET